MFSRWEQAAITKLRGHEFGLGVVEVGETSKVQQGLSALKQ